jgi:hypothetical protein
LQLGEDLMAIEIGERIEVRKAARLLPTQGNPEGLWSHGSTAHHPDAKHLFTTILALAVRR